VDTLSLNRHTSGAQALAVKNNHRRALPAAHFPHRTPTTAAVRRSRKIVAAKRRMFRDE
jgi:hypothetical protein